MLNKNNLLKNDKVVSKILDMAFIYKGNITPEIKEEFLEKITDLKKRGEISLASMQGDRDRGIYMNM